MVSSVTVFCLGRRRSGGNFVVAFSQSSSIPSWVRAFWRLRQLRWVRSMQPLHSQRPQFQKVMSVLQKLQHVARTSQLPLRAESSRRCLNLNGFRQPCAYHAAAGLPGMCRAQQERRRHYIELMQKILRLLPQKDHWHQEGHHGHWQFGFRTHPMG